MSDSALLEGRLARQQSNCREADSVRCLTGVHTTLEASLDVLFPMQTVRVTVSLATRDTAATSMDDACKCYGRNC